jgi:uncharacterized protein YjbI with pentapeptide repeats
MKTNYLIESLKEGVEYFNEIRKEKAEEVLKYPGAKLENLKDNDESLAGLDFTVIEEEDLSKINFMHLNLSECMLKGFNLNKVNFTGSDIKGTKLVDCDLSGCDFSKCDLSGVILRNCKTEGAKFKGAIVSEQVKSQISPSQFKETNNIK